MTEHKNTGNKHACKDETADSFLHIRVKRSDKAKWVRASPGKLSKWVIETLNDKCNN